MTSRGPTAIAAATLVLVTAAAILIVTGATRDPYVVHAQFLDASQLVRGNVVEVGGRRVGEVTAIELTDNGLADVEMTLKDPGVRPLRQGTRATVRTVGLSGVANRFVDLVPGPPTAPAIADGGVIPPERTKGIVDLDAVLNAIDGDVRADIRTIVREAAEALTPKNARQTNRGLAMLNPAVSRLTALARELVADEHALRSLLERSASVGEALAERRAALGDGIESTAGTLKAVASEREALRDALQRAPAAMAGTRRTLQRIRRKTLPEVEPFIRASRPAIKPLDRLLKTVEPTLDDALPVMREIRALLPQSREALAPLPGLERRAAPALRSGTKALKEALPLVKGLRPYTPDLVAGLVLGFGGSSSGYYDANGHYARVQMVLGPGSLPGLVPEPPGRRLGGYRTGKEARCPGAAEEPAPDRSNPWHDGAEGACTEEDDHP
jgi:phospholipid/cholesterol/gamma-HCH transport system substrate-binding protein